jgi:hypothetical protein
MRSAEESICRNACTSMAFRQYEVTCAASSPVLRKRIIHRHRIDSIYLQGRQHRSLSLAI